MSSFITQKNPSILLLIISGKDLLFNFWIKLVALGAGKANFVGLTFPSSRSHWEELWGGTPAIADLLLLHCNFRKKERKNGWCYKELQQPQNQRKKEKECNWRAPKLNVNNFWLTITHSNNHYLQNQIET